MAYNNHEYGNKGTYTNGMLKYLMAYNNQEYGSKNIYSQHNECLNT